MHNLIGLRCKIEIKASVVSRDILTSGFTHELLVFNVSILRVVISSNSAWDTQSVTHSKTDPRNNYSVLWFQVIISI